LVTRRDVGLRNLDKLRAYSGLRLGAQSVGHTNYTLGRIFAAVLGLKDTKYVTGYSIPERDVALMRGEIDAITNSDDFYARNPEWVKRSWSISTSSWRSPKAKSIRNFQVAEVDTFAKNDRTAKLLSMFRLISAFRLAVHSPAGNTQRSRGDHQRGIAQSVQRPGVRQRIQKSRR
jgi:hypothetical protein